MQRSEPAFNVPAGVTIMLALMVGVHGVRSLLPDDLDFELLVTLAFIPARYGDAVVAGIPGGGIAAVTSFATYMIVHADIVHLLVNSLWLLAFGSAIAKRAGTVRFAFFTIACGIAGAFTHLAIYFGDVTPVVGASAAISGQMAAALRFLLSGRGHISYSPESLAAIPLASLGETLRNPRIVAVIIVWTAINLLFGLGYINFAPGDAGIAWEAHIGGFMFGLLCFGLFDRPSPPRPHAVHLGS